MLLLPWCLGVDHYTTKFLFFNFSVATSRLSVNFTIYIANVLQLCASAQYWANILAHRDEFFHENPDDVGENLFAWPLPIMAETTMPKKCPEITGKDVASYWYKTMRNYYFLKAPGVLHAYASMYLNT